MTGGAHRNEAPSGVVVVDKPAGWTSHDVAARMRRLAGTRRVGHAGTLDPMATGVLVLGLGKATRLLGHLALAEKEYVGTVRLGVSTRTDDAEGEVTANVDTDHVTDKAVQAATGRLVGDLQQVPPAVSAVKVEGRRAYRRVRAGEQVELAARAVQVSAFDVTEVRRTGGCVDVDVSVSCSSGTYVRALARDLGAALGVGGHLSMLRRTRVGGFDLPQARTLDQLERELTVVPLTTVACRSFPTFVASERQAAWVSDGRVLPDTDLGALGPVAVVTSSGGDFLALYEQRGADARAVAVFV
ncbi:MAG: tRNA pseudouridine(55) synthase TruB [Nocardioidaceae bacterium]